MDVKNYINSGILEQYVLGLTSEAESAEVQQYAAQYPMIRKKIKKLESCMEHYSRLHAIPPPKKIKNRAFSEDEHLGKCRGLSLEYKRGSEIACPTVFDFTWIRNGVAIMLIFSLAALAYTYHQKQSNATKKLSKLSKEIKAIKEAYKSLNHQNHQLIQQYAILKDGQTQHVQLIGSQRASESRAVLYYNPSHKKTLLNVVNLPEPPQGHQYHLWADVDGQQRNLCPLETILDFKNKLQNIPFLEGMKGCAITLEEECGNQRPTTSSVYLKGQIGNGF